MGAEPTHENRSANGERPEITSRPGRPASTSYGAGFFLLLTVLGVGAVIMLGLDRLDTAGRNLLDTDGYLRAVRASSLATGETGWFDGTIARANAPFGHDTHWTRPMDVLIITIASPFVLLIGTVDGLYWGSALAGPVLLVACAAAMAWAAIPLVGWRLAYLAALIASLQPAVITYTQAGRADHHGLMLFLFLLSMGAAIRAASSSGDSAAVLGGLTLAVALWVSVESLIWIGLLWGLGCLSWMISAEPSASRQRTWWTTFALAVLGFTVAEQGGQSISEIAYDQISVPYVVLGASLAIAWWAVSAVESTGGLHRSSVIAMAMLVGITALSMMLLFPGIARGPLADYPTELIDRWAGEVSESARLLDAFSVSTSSSMLIAPVFGVVFGCAAAVKSSGALRRKWLLVAVAILIGTILTLGAARFAIYPQSLAAIPISLVCGIAIGRLESSRPLVRTPLVVVVVMTAALSWVIPLAVSPMSGGESSEANACSPTAAAELVARELPAGALVATDVALGPELLFRTSARVIATTQHRNVDGIIDGLDVFTEDALGRSRDILFDRGVDAVLFCVQGVPSTGADRLALSTILASGRTPPHLTPVADAGGYRLYLVAAP